jgi:hypothetical protein
VSTGQLEELLAASVDTISAFATNDTDAVLVLRPLPPAADNDASVSDLGPFPGVGS